MVNTEASVLSLELEDLKKLEETVLIKEKEYSKKEISANLEKIKSFKNLKEYCKKEVEK